MQTRTNKIIFISFLIIIILCLTIGYAVLSSKLTIGGTASVSGGGKWDVVFLKDDAEIKSEGLAICDIGTIEDTSIKNLSVILKEDGDSCTFTIPVENLGNMTAYLTDVIGKGNSITFDGLGNNIEKIRSYVNYEVKYGETQINSQTKFNQIAPLEAREKAVVILKASLSEGVNMEKMDSVTLGGFDRTFVFSANSIDGSSSSSTPTQITTPNTPVISGNMIPVYYDDGWKKADINNKDNKWYDYTNQKWANAVTTYDGTYQEKAAEVVPLNLKNEIPEIYRTTNDASYDVLTLNFSTGSSSGILSFDYSLSSETGYDLLGIMVNIDGQEEFYDVMYEDDLRHYNSEIPPNTSVEICAEYYKEDSYSSGNATISNLILPSNLSKELTMDSIDNSWEKIKQEGSLKYYVASNYKLNPITGKYTLENFDCHIFTSDDIDKYVCLDGSNSCDGNEIYKVKTVENNTITSVTKYTNQFISSNTREKYKNASAGTPIDMSDVNTMWVWIPRYAYLISKNFGKGGANASLPGEIEIKFLSSTAQADENWIVPSAFNFDGNKDGFWISKFEVTGDLEVDACIDENCDMSTVTILPGKSSLRSQKNASFFYIAKAMQKNTNTYGFTNSGDLHMIKNDEWGAVAYLSQSRYGKYGNLDYIGGYGEIYQNKSSSFITGSSNGTPSQASSRETQYAYDDMTELGKGKGQAGPGASTTGTIYGVYDMNGGAHEKVMAVIDYNNSPMSGESSDYNSGFSGVVYENGSYNTYTNIPFPDKKYFNEYKFSSIPSSGNFENTSKACNNGICFGQALSETQNWYDDYDKFAYNEYPWLARGGNYNSEEESGIFATSNDDGSSGTRHSTRFVLVP